MRRHDPVRRLSTLSPGARTELFRLLSESDEVRASAIGHLHSRTTSRELAEVLIDVEADPVLRLEGLRTLRDSLGRRPV
jgi:hypothetical protein